MVQEEVYKPRFWVAITSSFSLIIFLAVPIWAALKTAPLVINPTTIFFACITFIPFLLFAFVLYRYFVASNKILILTDTDVFYFGNRSQEIKYHKKDISQVLIYQPGSGKKIHYFYVYEISFKDGTSIKFSNIFISEQNVIDNFPTDLIRYSTNNTFFRI